LKDMIQRFEVWEQIGIVPYNFADDESYLAYLACTTEAATQTVREGERLDEDG